MSDMVSAYEYMWNRVIRKAIIYCYNEVDESFKDATGLEYVSLLEYRDDLEAIYKKKREWLKRKYLPDEKKPILDFHKLAAVMCRSIIGNKPFDFDVKEARRYFDKISKAKNITQYDKIKWEIDNVYVNYKLALLVAEGIVFDDLLFWAQDKVNEVNAEIDQNSPNIDALKQKLCVYEEFINKLKHSKRLYSYQPSEVHDNFFISTIIALMKTDYLKRDFDYLQFSINMFQWQEYTKKQYLYDIIRLKDLKFNFHLEDLV